MMQQRKQCAVSVNTIVMRRNMQGNGMEKLNSLLGKVSDWKQAHFLDNVLRNLDIAGHGMLAFEHRVAKCILLLGAAHYTLLVVVIYRLSWTLLQHSLIEPI